MDLEHEGLEGKREGKLSCSVLGGMTYRDEQLSRKRQKESADIICTCSHALPHTRLEGMRMDLCTYKHKDSPHLEQFPQSIAPEKDLFSFSKKY